MFNGVFVHVHGPREKARGWCDELQEAVFVCFDSKNCAIRRSLDRINLSLGSVKPQRLSIHHYCVQGGLRWVDF